MDTCPSIFGKALINISNIGCGKVDVWMNEYQVNGNALQYYKDLADYRYVVMELGANYLRDLSYVNDAEAYASVTMKHIPLLFGCDEAKRLFGEDACKDVLNNLTVEAAKLNYQPSEIMTWKDVGEFVDMNITFLNMVHGE